MHASRVGLGGFIESVANGLLVEMFWIRPTVPEYLGIFSSIWPQHKKMAETKKYLAGSDWRLRDLWHPYRKTQNYCIFLAVQDAHF